MKLAIITNTDGNFAVRSEHETRDSALIAYDQLHAALVNDKTCEKAVIKIIDDQLDDFEGNKWSDIIIHEVTKKTTKKEG